MQSYKTLQNKANKITQYINIINSLRVVQVGPSRVWGLQEDTGAMRVFEYFYHLFINLAVIRSRAL
jgi:hypothetical protein